MDIQEVQRGDAAAFRGRSSPLGASISPRGVNFSVFSRNASAIELLLFDRKDDDRPTRVIFFDPTFNRTNHYWHVFVPGAHLRTS
jgi:isoamylase